MKPVKSSIRDALQGQTLAVINPSDFVSQGGQLYYSLDSSTNQSDIHTMIRTFQAAHLPALGQHIPQSSFGQTTNCSGDSATTLTNPENNEVWKLLAVECSNSSLSAVTVKLEVTVGGNDITIADQVDIAAGAQGKKLDIGFPITIDSNSSLRLTHTADINIACYFVKVVQ